MKRTWEVWSNLVFTGLLLVLPKTSAPSTDDLDSLDSVSIGQSLKRVEEYQSGFERELETAVVVTHGVPKSCDSDSTTPC